MLICQEFTGFRVYNQNYNCHSKLHYGKLCICSFTIPPGNYWPRFKKISSLLPPKLGVLWGIRRGGHNKYTDRLSKIGSKIHTCALGLSSDVLSLRRCACFPVLPAGGLGCSYTDSTSSWALIPLKLALWLFVWVHLFHTLQGCVCAFQELDCRAQHSAFI